jgi:hypothetical protein
MHCVLAVPGLLAAKAPGRYPAIEMLLGRGRCEHEEPLAFEALLMKMFDVKSEGIPAGALTVLASGKETGEANWLRADPVHLQVMRDRLVVAPAEGLEISPDEAAALCAALNAHFAGTLAVEAFDPRRWTARVETAVAVSASPALDDAGREARLGGALLNEIQMLLHAHPVNAAREARGAPVLNSLWLWGAGRAPAASASWHSVVADEPLARGLGRLARARHGALPASAAAWLERAPQDGRHLVVLDALRAPAALEDLLLYEKKLNFLETAWFAPLLEALRDGRVGMLSVHVPDGGAAFETVRGDLRRFWRRPKALERLAS